MEEKHVMSRTALNRAPRLPIVDDPLRRFLADYFVDTLKIDLADVHDDLTLDQLGIDSIEIPGLIDRIAAFSGAELQIADFLTSRTLGELLGRIRRLPSHRPRLQAVPVPSPGMSQEAAPISAAPRALIYSKRAEDVAERFAEFMNPYLAARLRCMHLDREYVRGEGSLLTDADGRRILDFTSQYGALPFGYNSAEIWQAVERFRDAKLPSFVQVSVLGPASVLAERLVGCAPRGLSKVTFVNSGAEAIEAAIKLCRARTGRPGIVSADGGFHGKTMGALSATGRAQYREPFGLPVSGFVTVPYNNPGALERLFAAEPDYFAGFIIEPIQGEAGVVVPEDDYLYEVRAICRRHGVLLVVDEVQTGLGRTGRMFTTPDDLEPDVLALAKGLSGGLIPFGACLSRNEVYSEEFGLNHSSTFAGHGLGAVVGSAVLDMLQDPERNLMEHVAEMGKLLLSELLRLKEEYPQLIADVRGRGLMIGVEFRNIRDAASDSLLAISAEQEKLAALFASYLLNVHRIRVTFTLNNGNVLRVQPPFIVDADQCKQFIIAFSETLDAFSTLNVGLIYGRIRGRQVKATAARPLGQRRRFLAPAGMGSAPTFAFLYHPPLAASYQHMDPSFLDLPGDLQEGFARDVGGVMDPFVAAQTRYVSPRGVKARGVYIVVPHTAERLLALTRAEVQSLLGHCLDRARDYGAGVIGLGGFMSVICGGGGDLAGRGFAITSGNSLTAVAGLHQLKRMLAERNSSLARTDVAVLGAGGSIGRATAILLAREARSVLCLGNAARAEKTRERLRNIVQEICSQLLIWASDPAIHGGDLLAHTRNLLLKAPNSGVNPTWLMSQLLHDGWISVSIDLAEMQRAAAIVAAVSAPKPFVSGAHLRKGAIVCDLSRPSALRDDLKTERPDLTLVEAGHVGLPHRTDVGPFGLPMGQLYACMAETLLVTFEGATRDYSIGQNLSLEDLYQMEQYALRHGMYFA
jgi:acetylornithine/succinyldiaminopimelate/putrescine aminotransferase/predicted amino acid dehydrogenase/acyl carrier protein